MIHADVSSPEWQIFVMQENIDSRRRACAFIMGVPYEVRILATRNSRAWVLERSSTCNMLKGSGTCSLEHSRSRNDIRCFGICWETVLISVPGVDCLRYTWRPQVCGLCHAVAVFHGADVDCLRSTRYSRLSGVSSNSFNV